MVKRQRVYGYLTVLSFVRSIEFFRFNASFTQHAYNSICRIGCDQVFEGMPADPVMGPGKNFPIERFSYFRQPIQSNDGVDKTAMRITRWELEAYPQHQ